MAREADGEQIVALQVERNGADTEATVRELLSDPAVGPERFTVAVDGGRVVSSLCLLDQSFWLDGVRLPGAQVEYVATASDYGHRGLVAAQMEVVHGWSADRGDVIQAIAGIPYFYRRFGYEYAVPFPTIRLINPGIPLTMPTGWSVRRAVDDDLDELRRLQSSAQARFPLVALADDGWWERSMRSDGRPWFVAERDGTVRAAAMIGGGPPGVGQAVTVLHAPAADRAGGLWALLAEAAAVAGAGAGARAVGFESRGAATAILDGVSHSHPRSYALYARVSNPVTFLDTIRSVLSARLAASPRAGTSGTLLLSFYAWSVRLTWERGEVVAIESGPPEQEPTSEGGAGVPPDQVATLLLGRYGANGLAERCDDADYGAVADLMETLFPELRADLSLR